MKLYVNGKPDLKRALDKLSVFVDKSKKDKFAIEVLEVDDLRSLAFNKWYWGILIPAFMREGYSTKEEVHETLGRLFLSYKSEVIVTIPYCEYCNVHYSDELVEDFFSRTCPKCNRILEKKKVPVIMDRVKSTTTLSTKGFWEYIQKCKQVLYDKVGGHLTTTEYGELEEINRIGN